MAEMISRLVTQWMNEIERVWVKAYAFLLSFALGRRLS